jgi:hypothetical protein
MRVAATDSNLPGFQPQPRGNTEQTIVYVNSKARYPHALPVAPRASGLVDHRAR